MADTPSAYRKAQLEARKRVGAIERQIAAQFEKDVRRYADRVLKRILSSKRYTFDEVNALTAALTGAQNEFLLAVKKAVQESRDLSYELTLESWDRASAEVARKVGMGVIRAPNTALAGSFAALSGIYWETALVNSALGSAEELGAIVRTALLEGSDAEEIARRVRPYVNGSASFKDLVKDGKIDLRRIPPEQRGATRRMVVNARRIAFSELHNARREAEVQSYIRDPLVDRVRWTLSPNRGLKTFSPPDECDVLATADYYGLGAGIYPVDAVPPPPHPYDRCETIPVTRSTKNAGKPKPSPDIRPDYQPPIPNGRGLSPARVARIREGARRTVGYAEAGRDALRREIAGMFGSATVGAGIGLGGVATVASLESLTADVLLGEKLSGALGSNTGGWYLGTDGTKRYVKFYKEEAQARGEALANDLYRRLGLAAPKSTVAPGPGGVWLHAAEALEGDTIGSLGLTAQRADAILDGFATDVLVGNWDAVGMGLDNVIETADGLIARIDQGGAFLMRAQAGRKPVSLLEQITEWDGFTNPSINADYRRVFQKAGLSSADDLGERIAAQVDRILALEKEVGGWPKYVERMFPGWKSADRKAVASMLEARTKLLAAKAAEAKAAKAAKGLVDDLQAGRKTAQAVLDEAWVVLGDTPAFQALAKSVDEYGQSVIVAQIKKFESGALNAKAVRADIDDLLARGVITAQARQVAIQNLVAAYDSKFMPIAKGLFDGWVAGPGDGAGLRSALKNILDNAPDVGGKVAKLAQVGIEVVEGVNQVVFGGGYSFSQSSLMADLVKRADLAGLFDVAKHTEQKIALVRKMLPDPALWAADLISHAGAAEDLTIAAGVAKQKIANVIGKQSADALFKSYEGFAFSASRYHALVPEVDGLFVQAQSPGTTLHAKKLVGELADAKVAALDLTPGNIDALEAAIKKLKTALQNPLGEAAVVEAGKIDDLLGVLYDMANDVALPGKVVLDVVPQIKKQVLALKVALEDGSLSPATVQKKLGALRKQMAANVYAAVEDAVLLGEVGKDWVFSALESYTGKAGNVFSKAAVKKAAKAAEETLANAQAQIAASAPATSGFIPYQSGAAPVPGLPQIVNKKALKAVEALDNGADASLVAIALDDVHNLPGALADLESGNVGRISARKIILRFEANDALDPGGADVYVAARQEINALRAKGLIDDTQATIYKNELKEIGDKKFAQFKAHQTQIVQATQAAKQAQEAQAVQAFSDPKAPPAEAHDLAVLKAAKKDGTVAALETWTGTHDWGVQQRIRGAVDEWVGGAWERMNRFLRKVPGVDAPNPANLGRFRFLDAVLQKAPKYTKTTFRGDGWYSGDVSKFEHIRGLLRDAHQGGGAYYDPGYFASSRTWQFPESWVGGKPYKIMWTVEGKSGVSLGDLGNPTEREVLMPRGRRFKVLDYREQVIPSNYGAPQTIVHVRVKEL